MNCLCKQLIYFLTAKKQLRQMADAYQKFVRFANFTF